MTKKNKNDQKKPLDSFIRYSASAIQMGAAIAICAYGGVKLDEWLNTGPWFTVGLSLFGVFAGLYLVLKDLIKQ
jgi:F0F1-type ATP synthase assembly protein I